MLSEPERRVPVGAWCPEMENIITQCDRELLAFMAVAWQALRGFAVQP